jgi:phospholipid/cholesterol/gamma-HCH transport system substrate-binding protein
MPMDVYRKGRLLFLAFLGTAGLAALAWYLSTLGQYATYRVETTDPVSGLIPGSPVEFHGVQVGKVTEVKLLDAHSVGVLLSVDRLAPISRATVATITTRGLAAQGFTGYGLIALENTGPASGPLTTSIGQRHPIIFAARSRIMTMDTGVAEATQAVQTIKRLLETLLDDKAIESLKRSVEGLAELSTTFVGKKQRLESLIDEMEADSRDIRPLLQSLQDEKTIASLKSSIDGLAELTATLAANTRHLESLLVNVDPDSREIQPLIEITRTTLRQLNMQVLPQFDRAIGHLNALSQKMNGLADDLSRHPSDLLHGKVTPPGPGER